MVWSLVADLGLGTGERDERQRDAASHGGRGRRWACWVPYEWVRLAARAGASASWRAIVRPSLVPCVCSLAVRYGPGTCGRSWRLIPDPASETLKLNAPVWSVPLMG